MRTVKFGTDQPADYDPRRIIVGLGNMVDELVLPNSSVRVALSLISQLDGRLQDTDTFELVLEDKELVFVDMASKLAGDAELFKYVVREMSDAHEVLSDRDVAPQECDVRWAKRVLGHD